MHPADPGSSGADRPTDRNRLPVLRMSGSMRLKIRHATRYRFETPVKYGLQQLRKTPKSTAQQSIRSWRTKVENGRKELSFEDYRHNTTELISFAPGATELSVISEGDIDVTDTGGIVGPHRGPAPLWLYLRDTVHTR